MANAFSGGVGMGGLHDTEDIKLLVMYVLKTVVLYFMLSKTNVLKRIHFI